MFARKVLDLDRSNLNRLRRLLRAYYRSFDGLFVLNTDQEKWLTGRSMGFNRSSVFLTAHWADEIFQPWIHTGSESPVIPEKGKIVLFVGRISREKGVMELPELYKKVREEVPGIRFVIAGTGPEENELKEIFPEAIYLGWVDHSQLPQVFSAADLLVLPSKFDTFSCVVLESLSCGLPVIAYKTKGPKDIIQDGVNGFLVSNPSEMANRVIRYFSNNSTRTSFRKKALIRAKQYSKAQIVDGLLHRVGLSDEEKPLS
jgi:glycosyltransferase involved in cell wall biosynthesis